MRKNIKRYSLLLLIFFSASGMSTAESDEVKEKNKYEGAWRHLKKGIQLNPNNRVVSSLILQKNPEKKGDPFKCWECEYNSPVVSSTGATVYAFSQRLNSLRAHITNCHLFLYPDVAKNKKRKRKSPDSSSFKKKPTQTFSVHLLERRLLERKYIAHMLNAQPPREEKSPITCFYCKNFRRYHNTPENTANRMRGLKSHIRRVHAEKLQRDIESWVLSQQPTATSDSEAATISESEEISPVETVHTEEVETDEIVLEYRILPLYDFPAEDRELICNESLEDAE